MRERRRCLVEPLEGRQLLAAATINWNDARQTIDGFGASSAWMWSAIPAANLPQLYSTTTGAGLSLLRSHMYPQGWSSETAVMQQVAPYGVTVWSTPWTPPREWKTNHDNNNGGSLKPEHYQDYANLLADYVQNMKAQGVPLYAISLQNEPNWTADYESCRWDAQQFADFLPFVGQTFATRGVTAKIMLPESLNWDFSLASTIMADPALAQYVGILAAHNYGETAGSYNPVTFANGLPVWETEIYSHVTGTEIATAVDVANDIHQALSDAGASAYHYWWINSSSGSQLMTNWVASKRLWAMGQYSRFVRPGWVMVGHTDDGGLDITAFKDPASGKFAIVVVNGNTSGSITETYTLNGITAGSVTPYTTSATSDLAAGSSITLTGGTVFTATIAASSIVTYYGIASTAPALQAPGNLKALPQYQNLSSQIALSWSDNSSSETNYTVERSTDGSTWSVVTSTLAANTIAYVDTGRSENTAYYYRVKATSGGNSSPYSMVASTSTVLLAPSGIGTWGTNTSGYNLGWTVNSAVTTGGTVQRSMDGLTWTQIATLPAGRGYYSDTIPGFDPNQIYYYRLRNVAGSTTSGYASWNSGLKAPTNFAATNVTPTSVTFTWTSPTVGASGAQIEQYNPSGGTWTMVSPSSLQATDGAWTLSGLTPLTSYTFRMRVTAVSDSLNSGYSSSLAVTTPFQTIWYKANESSGTTLNDAFNSARNATLSGTTSFAAGISGNAVTLAGGYATLPSGMVAGLNDFTIATWVKVTTLAAGARIFDFGTGTSTSMYLAPQSGTGMPRFAITTSGSGGEQQINSSVAITAGAWTHVAVTLSGSIATLYINGVAAGTNTGMTLRPSSLGATTQNYLGKSQSASDPNLQGSLDDFRIYGRALLAAEIQALATPVSQLAWLKADESSGVTLVDASGMGNEAALAGSYSFAPGVSGNAISLTGGYATLPVGIAGGLHDFTIATWVNLPSLATWARIFDFGSSTTSYMFLTARASGTNLPRFAINSGSGEQVINSSVAIAASTWTHVALTLRGNSATLYINGVVAGTNTSMTTHPAALGATTQNYIGKSQWSNDPNLQGSIDDFRLYSRTLSLAEVLNLVDPSYPTGWADADLGAPALTGAAHYDAASSTWTVSGSGADIWNTSDQFHYVYQAASGDFAITARVTSQTNSNTWAKAGVMMRDGTAANAAFAAVFVRPDNQVAFQWRRSAGASAQGTTVVGGSGTKYLKLERTAGMFTGYYSSDGISWTPAISPTYVYMPNAVTAGLAVTSHDNALFCNATFTNVRVLPAATVTAMTVSSGDPQRSRITSLTVAFSGPVTPAADAFTLVRRSDGLSIPVAASPAGDRMSYVLTFSGAALESGSLPDGLYDFAVRGASLRDDLGQSLTGGTFTLLVHRLFGDGNGDRRVDATDQAQFQLAQTGYNASFDVNADGIINGTDTAAFNARLSTSLFVPSLPSAPSWTSSGVLMGPPSDATHTGVSIKDPTVVFHNGKWYVFASWTNPSGAYSMVYYSFADWSQASAATPFFLDTIPGYTGYKCAPEILFLRPLNKWVLIFQSPNPQYATLDDINHPELLSAPQPLFYNTPANASNWIDFNIIADDTYAYLFFTKDNGEFWRSRTRLSDFPNGFTEPTLVMSKTSGDLFEASHTYRLAGMNQYLTIIEAFGLWGRRYYTSYIADRLDGAWTPLGTSYNSPFASYANVTFPAGMWSEHFSHGEIIRSTYDETMTVDPARLQLLYQGFDGSTVPSGTDYNLLPWKLGLLTIANPAAPASVGFAVSGGSAQRSMVTGVTVTFDKPVSLAAGAITLTLRNGTSTFATTITNPSADGRSYLLSFSGSSILGGSLPDGIYDLRVAASLVQDARGQSLSGGDRLFSFHRLFGDSNGDRRVNLVDYRAMRVTLGRSGGHALFNSAFDVDGNGTISVLDLAQFRRRFGMVFRY